MVPGIGPSPDKMLLGRLFSYPDTHRYRIGAELPAAAGQPSAVPGPQLQQGRRDALREPGRPGLRAEHRRRPGRRRGALRRRTRPGTATARWCAPPTRCAPTTTTSARPGTLVREVMSQADRDNLAANILGHAGDPDVTARDEAADRRVLDERRRRPRRGRRRGPRRARCPRSAPLARPAQAAAGAAGARGASLRARARARAARAACAWGRADDRLGRRAVLEEDHRRDRQDLVLGRRLLVVVDVELHDLDVVALGGDLLEDRRDGAARTAPGRPEVDEDRRARTR